MTYKFYKENEGKLTREERARFSLLGARLRHEEQVAEVRQTGLAVWRARANLLNKGDLEGLLYDIVQRRDAEIKRLNEILVTKEAVIDDLTPWKVNFS